MLIDFRQLFPKYNIKPKGVLHVGANVGEERDVYLELGIKNQIWVEANPTIFHKLKQNISGNPKAKALNYCVSDRVEEVTFHISNNGSQSSSILELGTHKDVHPDVHYVDSLSMTAYPLKEILLANLYCNPTTGQYDNIECDFLNIDLQGAELKALIGLGDMLNQFRWLYLEVNKAELYKGCCLVDELDNWLWTHYNFKRVETKWAGNTNWGDALYVKN